jgi:pimeloyl-ACP methyl ester carboxylesterase
MFLYLFIGLVVILGLFPFFIPVRPLPGVDDPRELADQDSQFIIINDIQIHYKIVGTGEPVFILLHGFASNLFSWRNVMNPLSKMGTVIAFDRTGFGLSDRPMAGDWSGQNPYSPEYASDLVPALMDKLGISKAMLVGNSAGGSISVLTTLRHPERVRALVLVDAAIYSGRGVPRWIKPIMKSPQINHLGPLVSRIFMSRGNQLIKLAWHDPSKATVEVLEGYRKSINIKNWDRALWEFTLASHPINFPARLGEIQAPVLVIAGDDDRIVPTNESIKLSHDLSNSRLVIIPQCGHVPQEECPDEFITAIENYVTELWKA